MTPKLDERLEAAVGLGRPGKRFADVGTDHAYLPIALVTRGLSDGGIATDIRDGPVSSARRNVAEAGLSSEITVLKRDGLDGVEAYSPEDIYILGMGGELIRDIISKSSYAANPGVRLILQPMTKPEALRVYLAEAGFRTVDERLVGTGRRIYQLISAEYDGRVTQLSDAEALLGKINISRGGPLLSGFASRLSRSLRRAAAGIASAGKDASKQSALADELDAIAGI